MRRVQIFLHLLSLHSLTIAERISHVVLLEIQMAVVLEGELTFESKDNKVTVRTTTTN